MKNHMTEAGAHFTLTKWVPALRSGNYLQGKCRLRTANNQFCCLGVACDLLASDGLGWWEMLDDGQYSFTYVNGDANGVVLPRSVADAFGMTDDGLGIVPNPNEETNEPWLLMNANDYGVPFHEIADHLETHANESLKAIEAERAAMNADARQETPS